jgi:cytochrome c oxidase subunit IV
MAVETYPDPQNAGPKAAHPGVWTYILIWALLLVLTAVTVFIANLNMGGLTVIVSLSVAAAKSALVLLFFMHLISEKRLVIRLLIPIVIIILAIFIGLTYSDVVAR